MQANLYSKQGLNYIEVINDLDLKVVFCDLGASIFNIYFHDECMTRNVRNIKDYKNPKCYYGKTIGRTSNRLKGYRFEIHDEIYDLECNEGYNVLHGGKSGLSNQTFKSQVDTYDEYIQITYSYFSKHLESGYPGNVDIKVIYKIYKGKNVLEVTYEGISDMDTLFSMTNHSYFTLGDMDISNLDLFIRGHKYLDVNKDNLLPIDIKNVDQVMNFSKYKKILKDIDSISLKGKMMNGYDSYFYFDSKDINKINISLRNEKYRLDIYSDFEGCQIYSSNYEPEFDLDNEVKYRDSVAIEPSDTFFKFPVLLKDTLYTRTIRYKFIDR